MTLQGKRVLVTRAPHQAAAVVDLLTSHGAHVFRYPCIEIVPPEDTSEIDALLANAQSFDWLILTSPNTIYALKQRMDALDTSEVWRSVKVAAVGPKTARIAAQHLNVEVACVPDEHTGAALAEMLHLSDGAKIALPQSELADKTLPQSLVHSGADVTNIVAYRNVIAQGGDVIDGRVDALTFTSGSTVQNFITRWAAEGREWGEVRELPAACIGPVTGDAARECGFTWVIVPKTYTLAAMVDALCAAMAS